MKTTIAGIPHRKPDLTLLALGDLVSLVPEPENKFDPNAIKVMHGETHLGYIPKIETHFLCHCPPMYVHEIAPARKWTEVVIDTEPYSATTIN